MGHNIYKDNGKTATNTKSYLTFVLIVKLFLTINPNLFKRIINLLHQKMVYAFNILDPVIKDYSPKERIIHLNIFDNCIINFKTLFGICQHMIGCAFIIKDPVINVIVPKSIRIHLHILDYSINTFVKKTIWDLQTYHMLIVMID